MKLITADTLDQCPLWSQWLATSAQHDHLRRALDEGDWTTVWTHFEPVVGIEAHIGLRSTKKLFSGASRGEAGWLDLGFPGAMPHLDEQAVHCAVMVGASVDASIPQTMFFERKRYAYPDLSKGYQTTQKTSPVWTGGRLQCSWGTLPLIRAQLEEDAASVSRQDSGFAMDFVRAGAPLLEVVSDVACMQREHLVEALKTLYFQGLVLSASDGKIEEGQFKADINLSIRPRGSQYFSERWEIKGVGSFEFAGMSFNDAMRQRFAALLDASKTVQERLGEAQTMGFSEDTGQCYTMRKKLSEHQYRFLPCPDLGELPVPRVDRVAHTYRGTLDWLQSTVGPAFLDKRWATVLEQRSVLQFLGARQEFESASPDMLWAAIAWLPGHAGAALGDVWDALRASESLDAFKHALKVLEEGPWSRREFEERLAKHQGTFQKWDAIQGWLSKEFADKALTDAKFRTAIEEYQRGKVKARGYIQGQLMAYLKTQDVVAGELLAPWLDQHLSQFQFQDQS